MLILTRKPRQSIIIGDGEIEVYFDSFIQGQARFCITAPKNIQVNRKEIYNSKIRHGHLKARHGDFNNLNEVWNESLGNEK